MGVRLRPVRLGDEQQFHDAHASLWAGDRFEFGLGYDPDEPFGEFVERQRRFARGDALPEGFVPATFLVAAVGTTIVGRVSIRHELNDHLAAEGGHIGYGVLEPFRRRGYATAMLRQSLIIARSLGVDTVMLTCDDTNLASARVIERCDGQLRDRVRASDGRMLRRYDISLG